MYTDVYTGSLEVMRAMMSANILLMEGGTEQKSQRQRGIPEVLTTCYIQEYVLNQCGQFRPLGCK